MDIVEQLSSTACGAVKLPTNKIDSAPRKTTTGAKGLTAIARWNQGFALVELSLTTSRLSRVRQIESRKVVIAPK